MGRHWSPTFLPVSAVRDKGIPLDATSFGKKVAKDIKLERIPLPQYEERITVKPQNLFLFFQPYSSKTRRPTKAVLKEERAKAAAANSEAGRAEAEARAIAQATFEEKQAEKTKIYEKIHSKASAISTSYLLAHAFMSPGKRKRYEEQVKQANERRRASGKPTK